MMYIYSKGGLHQITAIFSRVHPLKTEEPFLGCKKKAQILKQIELGH